MVPMSKDRYRSLHAGCSLGAPVPWEAGRIITWWVTMPCRLLLLVMAMWVLSPARVLAQAGSAAQTGTDRQELAAQAQNPLAFRINLTALNNASFGLGPRNATLDVLNLLGVAPVRLNEDWSIITRAILPVVSQPGIAPGTSTIVGLGPTQVSFF